ncbi:MAG: alpha/beta hydrolase [Hassallia sp. WJT32-NPBG1]|jgi:predicted dienelactone hydrolase|nr:alpha/beta hydrolase [Hassallia sp. WJT32-NPBG1]
MKKFLRYLSFGLISTVLTATPSIAADQIAFDYPPFGEFTLATESLETFAREGKINKDFAFYAQRATPQQLAQLRELLQQKFKVTPTLVSQFSYSPLGEKVVQRLGELIQTDTRKNGFYAIRAALILAAADPQGLTVVNVLRRFPSKSVRINFTEGLQVVSSLTDLLKRRDATVAFIQREANAEAEAAKVDFSKQPDLRSPGNFRFSKISLQLKDQTRDRRLPVDLYLPTPPLSPSSTPPLSPSSTPFPLIVISHGVASDRFAFVYVAQHLASYGFAVAVLEHPGSNAERFQRYFSGLAGPPEPAELINRPLDVKFVLNELQRLEKSNPQMQGKLNFQQVGAFGHSYGGYTVFSLAGAKINFEQIRRDCNPNKSLNLSVFLQCRANELKPTNYALKDDRIKAVFAVNPFVSSIFNQTGVSQIKLPLMVVAGSQDIVTPAVPEQILPFTWLGSKNKYLAVIENGTHFTALAEPTPQNDVLPVPPALLGPDRSDAHSYLNALSVAFFETYLLNRPEYQVYLQPAYAKYISKAPLNLSFLQSLRTEQLTPFLNGTRK